MHKEKEFAKKYFTPLLKPWRKARQTTQERASEALGISSRAYANLERGKSGFSVVTLLRFLSMFPDDEMVRLVRGFCEGIPGVE